MSYAGANPTNNYVGGFHFKVSVNGFETELDGFTSCSGIKAVSETFQFKHGMDLYKRIAPGINYYEPVVLERVFSGLDEFAMWRDRIEAGVNGTGASEIDRRDVVIEILTGSHEMVARYLLVNAFPSRWETPDLSAMDSGPAIERIELSFERCLREASGEHLSLSWVSDIETVGYESGPYKKKGPAELPDWASGFETVNYESGAFKRVGPKELPDWIHGNEHDQTQHDLQTPDWVTGNGHDQTQHDLAPPDWVKGHPFKGGASAPKQPDWVKKPGSKEAKASKVDFPDWVKTGA